MVIVTYDQFNDVMVKVFIGAFLDNYAVASTIFVPMNQNMH